MSEPIKSLDKEEASNKEGNRTLTYNFILTIIILLILFFESIYILLSAIRKGFIKKEVLTTKSNFGFDIIIKG
tara:strand:- start:686 stop:904 length:219 start_codon:yes stop_codon:yes gene_type:complete